MLTAIAMRKRMVECSVVEVEMTRTGPPTSPPTMTSTMIEINGISVLVIHVGPRTGIPMMT